MNGRSSLKLICDADRPKGRPREYPCGYSVARPLRRLKNERHGRENVKGYQEKTNTKTLKGKQLYNNMD